MNKSVETPSGHYVINHLPNSCPFCHQKIVPIPIYGYYTLESNLDVFFRCPDSSCNSTFIGYYQHNFMSIEFNYNGKTSIGNLSTKEFSPIISDTYTSFCSIYNEAYIAEQQNLLQICGVGYRKALEFLIKDYAINNSSDDQESIQKNTLANCIKKYVSDNRIKDVVSRAVWLGNDETHYIKKWEHKNLKDLKTLIDLTVHWIEMEILTAKFKDDMPES